MCMSDNKEFSRVYDGTGFLVLKISGWCNYSYDKVCESEREMKKNSSPESGYSNSSRFLKYVPLLFQRILELIN